MKKKKIIYLNHSTYKSRYSLLILGVIQAFLPGSQIDVVTTQDFDAYLEKEIDVKIKLNESRKNIVFP